MCKIRGDRMTGLFLQADAYVRAAAGRSELTSASRSQVTSASETNETGLAHGESGECD